MRRLRGPLLALAALLALVVLAEIGLRLVGRSYLELVRTPPEDFTSNARLNILCLGDSFTFGIGADGEASYPEQLARLLAARYGDEACQVINWGLPAQNSSEALLALEAALSREPRPDFVLLSVGINNYWNWHLATPFLPGDRPLGKLHAALGGLRLWRLAAAAVSGGPVAAAKLYAENDAGDSRDPWFSRLRDRQPQWIVDWLARDLAAAAECCAAHSVRLVLVGYHDPGPLAQTAYEQAAQRPDAIFVDCRAFGRTVLDPQFISADGWHPNTAGYRLIAALVAERLVPMIEAERQAE